MARWAAAVWLLFVWASTAHAGGLRFPLSSGNGLWSSIVGHVAPSDEDCNGCQLSKMVTHCPLDVVFLLDGSDSIPPLAYQRAVDYVIREIGAVTSTFPGSDVGVLIFSKVVEKEFEIRSRTQNDLSQLYQAIRATKQPRKGSLLTDVMREARRLLERYDGTPLVLGSRRGKLIVLLSDGCLDGVQATLEEGRLSAKQGIYILSVAMSQAVMPLLSSLSVQVLEQRTPIDWKSIAACPTRVLPAVSRSTACDDFVLVMDGSDSVRRWEGVMRDYMAATSLRFQNVDNSIGVIVFGTNVTAQSSDTMVPPLKNKVQLAQMIETKLRFPHSGGTGTTAAIQAAVQLLATTSSNRRKTIIVVTDGPALNPISAQEALATAVRQGTQVVVIGVGDAVTREELQALVGYGSRIEQVESYLDLYGLDISSSICNGATVSCYPPNVYNPSTGVCEPCTSPLEYDYTKATCVSRVLTETPIPTPTPTTPTPTTCQLSCAHGYLDRTTSPCRCVCELNWTGVTCNVCLLSSASCQRYERFSTATCTCDRVCNTQQTYNQITGRCDEICTLPKVLDTLSGTCVCSATSVPCRASETRDSNTCTCVAICSPPTIYNANTRSCQQCTPPLAYDYITGTCLCTLTQASCRASETFNSGSCSCVSLCNPPQVYNTNTRSCQSCTPPLTYDYITRTCVCTLTQASCQASETFNSGSCSCVSLCNAPQVYNTNTRSCQQCTPPLTYDYTTRTCVCTLTQASCQASETFNSGSCSCVSLCNAPQVYNTNTRSCQQCTPPLTYDYTTRTCVCTLTQASCRASETFNSGSCSCACRLTSASCQASERFDSTNCSCVAICSPPTIYNANTRSCQQCIPPLRYDYTTRTCVCTLTQASCRASEIFNSGSCSCACRLTSASCQASERFDSTNCSCVAICSPPTIYNANTRSCQQCTPPLTYDYPTRSCVCTLTQASCRASETFNSGSCSCACRLTSASCQASERFDSTTCSCVPLCNPPLFYNSITRSCECQARTCQLGQIWDYQRCSCVTCPVQICSPDQVWNSTTCSCTPRCFSPQIYDPSQGCVCPAQTCSLGLIWDSQLCRCVPCPVQSCSFDQVWSQGTCSCAPRCTSLQVYDPVRGCVCTEAACPVGQVQNATTCICGRVLCDPCIPPKILTNTDTCQCDCPSVVCSSRNQFVNSGTCQCECGLSSCPAGYKLDSNQCTCVLCSQTQASCSSGYYYDQNTCSCRQCVVRSCPSDQVWNSTTCSCTSTTCQQTVRCPAGSYFDEIWCKCMLPSCTQTSCPSGFFINTTTCVCQQACDFSRSTCVYGTRRSQPTATGQCCDCQYGFTGEFCDRCDARLCQCQNGGTPNAYPVNGQCICTCPPGYTGIYCDTPVVTPAPCASSSVRCVYGVTRSQPSSSGQCCDCNYGFTGAQCDQCDTRLVSCQNGGTPTQYPVNGQCACTCPPGYTGRNCETRVCNTACAYGTVDPVTCQCVCFPGFVLNDCSQCDILTIACLNGGYPQIQNNQCQCFCPSGFTGSRCELNGNCLLNCVNGSPDRPDEPCTSCICYSGWSAPYAGGPCTVPVVNTTAELCLPAETPCANGQPAYRDCNGRCVCRCDTRFYTGPNCEYRVEPKLCDNCLFQNGNYLAPVQGRCDLYVVCQPTNEEQTEFIPWVLPCPAGTMFQTTGTFMGCIGFGEGTCSSDPCQTLGTGGRYAHATECARYYECSNQATAASQCCPAGQGFNARTQQCENNAACANTCAGTYRSCDSGVVGRVGVTCPYKPRPNNESYYYHVDAVAFSYPCGLQRIFNATSCLCQDDPRAGCGPTIDFTFDTSSPNKSVPIRTVSGGNGRAGYFDGTSRVVIYRFSNSGFYTDYFEIKFRAKPSSVSALGAGEMVLVSNGDCGVTESLAIVLGSNYVSFKVQQEGSSRLEVLRVPFSSYSDWLDIDFVYERVGDGLYRFTGTVNGHSQTLEMTSVIATRACAIHIAQGLGYRNLDGYVDDFQIWMCKPSTFG